MHKDDLVKLVVASNSRKRKRAQNLIPNKVRLKLRKAFTPKGMDFFEFYVKLREIYFEVEDATPDLAQEFIKATGKLAQVTSPVDGKPLAPSVINQIAEARTEVRKHLTRIYNRPDDELNWRKANSILMPLYTQVARDKGVYIRPKKQPDRSGFASMQPMSAKQEKIEKLRDTDPESYALMMRKQMTIAQIDAEITKAIEREGLKVVKKFVMGRPVQFGLNEATGDMVLYDRDGDILTFDEYVAKRKQDAEAKKRLARIPARTEVPLDQLRQLPQELLDQLEGDTEYMSLTDDIAKAGKLTRIYPTKKHYVKEFDPETNEMVERGYKVVTQGRYAGIFIDDLINSQGRLIEGTSYTYSVKKGDTTGIPVKIDPSEREPYVSVGEMATKVGSRTIKEKKLFIKVGSGREFKELRDALKQISSNTPPVRGSIPSVIWASQATLEAKVSELIPKLQEIGDGNALRTARSILKKIRAGEKVPPAQKKRLSPFFKQFGIKGSNEASFYFDPKDYAAIRDRVKGMSLSKGATAMLESYFKEVSEAEAATVEENLGFYSTRQLGGFVQSKKNPRTGEMRPVDLNVKQKQALAWLDANGNKGVCGLDTGLGKCIRHDSIVVTNKGLVQIQDMNPGIDTPDTWAPVDGWEVIVDGKSLPVKNFYYGGEKPTRKITTRYGFELEGSLKHPLMVRNAGAEEDWVRTPELQAGDYLCVERIESEGPQVEPLIDTGKATHQRMNPDFARSLGVQLGVTSREKTIPTAILKATRDSQAEFLRGFIDAEGSVNVSGLEVSTASEQLGRELQLLLLQFGIVAKRRPKFVEGYDHTYWRLQIQGDDARRFMSKIGLVSKRKIESAQATFMSKDSNPNNDVIPHAAPLVAALHREIMASFDGNKTSFRMRFGSSIHNTMNHVRFGRRNLSYPSLKKMLHLASELGVQDTKAFKDAEGVYLRNFFYDPIQTITEGRALVMDVEVDDPSHCFVGNGLMNHNTLTSVAMMQKLVRDGLTDEGATYTSPDGKEVETNGRFLYVCPKALKGNLPKEINQFISDPRSLRDIVDVMSYREFSGSSRSKKIPRSLRKTPFWKGKQRLDMTKYVAIFFDEAHTMVNHNSSRSKAAQNLRHPRKILLTASPMEKSPMESYVLAAIANNKRLHGRTDEAKKNRREMRLFKDRFCEVLGGRIMGLKQDPEDPGLTQDLMTWVKRNIYYADKTDNEDVILPDLKQATNVVEMDPEVEEVYREISGSLARTMTGLASKYRDRGLMEDGKINPDARAPDLDRVFKRSFAQLLGLMNGLSNYPGEKLREIADIIENNSITNSRGEQVPIPRNLWRPLKAIREKYSPEQLREFADRAGNPKLTAASNTIREKIANSEGESRSLVFSDDKKLCMMSGAQMSRDIPGIHAVALNSTIHFFKNGEEISEYKVSIPDGLIEALAESEEAAEEIKANQGIETHRLPFRSKRYRRYPSLGVHPKHNTHYNAPDWQTFVLREIVTKDKSIKTTTLLGKSYETGQNLQAFDQVVHLDRDTFNSESMKQRTARAWRQGQTKPVDEVTIDAVYADTYTEDGQPKDSSLDITLDEISRAYQQVEGALFDDIIKGAQKTALGGEWQDMTRKDASNYRLDEKVIELLASPYLDKSTPPGEF